MSTGHILLLGAIAGATIFLGLPVGRIQGLTAAARAGLSALATGILLFLLWDVLTGAVDPVESALKVHHWGRFSWLAALAFGGFALGLLSLVYYDSWMKARRRKNRQGKKIQKARRKNSPRFGRHATNLQAGNGESREVARPLRATGARRIGEV